LRCYQSRPTGTGAFKAGGQVRGRATTRLDGLLRWSEGLKPMRS